MKKSNNQAGLLVLLVFLLFSLSPALAHSANDDEYIMGVFPFLPVANLEGIFAPIAAEISAKLDKPVRFRLTSTYEAFILMLKDESFDIAHIHPFDYIRYAYPQGYSPLVARADELYALFSTKKGSGITSIRELRGKRLGTPPAGGSVTYLALDTLYQEGIAPSELRIRHFPNHLACLQNLQIGNVDACATSASTLKVFSAQFGINFKQIGSSQEIPHTMFAVSRRVSPEDRAVILETLLESNLSTVKPRLRELFIASRDTETGNYFKKVSDRDYNAARDILRRIGKN